MPYLRYEGHRTATESFDQLARARITRLEAVLKIGTTPHFNTTIRDNSVRPLALKTKTSFDDRPSSCDRGHLVALEFAAPDSSDNLVPMWGGFNAHGQWRVFEGELDNWACGIVLAKRVLLTIECAYLGDDPRIPSAFKITALTDTNCQKQWQIPHPKPMPVAAGADPAGKALLIKEMTEMNDLRWCVESCLGNDRVPRFPVVGMGALASRCRPYAVLDYMDWKAVKDHRQNLAAWRSVLLVSNGGNFDAWQRARIVGVNRIMHDGFIKSDDANDVAYTNLTYRMEGYDAGILVEGDRDLAPEIDHIVAKSMGGPKSFSNAQILSGIYNKNKSARQDAVNLAAILGNVRRGRSAGLALQSQAMGID
jgi:hypothetical protein